MSIYRNMESSQASRKLELLSPVTLEVTGELVCASREEVQAAVQRARSVQPSWAALSFRERGEYMQRMIKKVQEKEKEIIDTVVRETGKAYTDAYTMEVFSCYDSLCYYAKNAEKFLSVRKHRPHGVMGFTKRVEWVYQPLGVIGIITPWNGPFVLALNQGCQAMMAGNTVVVKGSEVTPYSTKLVETLFLEAGLPEGVFQVLMGDGQTGADLIESGVDKVSFTGSVATGKKVGEACGRKLLPCTLELGGKDAMIVCADANLERAAQGAVIGSCMNSGHYCCGTERIYVVEEVYDAFVEKVTARVKELKQGPELGQDEDVGAIFWDRQMGIIEEHIRDAEAKGAQVLVGGKRNPDQKGLYYLPTVVTDVNHDMTIMRKETFGPVLCIQKVKNEDEAVQLANDSEYGLSGTVWTNDNTRAKSLAERIHTGSVCINDMTVTYGIPVAPFGGVKDSGVGLVNGETGLRGYCQLKPVIYDRNPKRPLASGYPYSADKVNGIKKFAEFIWLKTPLGRWLS